LRSPVCSVVSTSDRRRVFFDCWHASSCRVISSMDRNRSRRSSLAILNTGSLLTSSQASAKRRIDRSSAHSRLTVAGDSFPPRREVVPSRATRYSATRRVSSIERLPSLSFSVRNFSNHHGEGEAPDRGRLL
jgi:hypothetical protein